MSTLKISKHSDVPAALDLLREEVDKEAKRIFSAGGDALKVFRKALKVKVTIQNV